MTAFLLAALLLAIVIAAMAATRSKTRSSEVATMDLASIQPGPIQHSELPPALVARIEAFAPGLEDVYPKTLDEWIEGFCRDTHPESEVVLWEQIAFALGEFSRRRALSADERREAFGLLLMRSCSDAESVSASAELQHLGREDLETLLTLYSAPPKPIVIVDS